MFLGSEESAMCKTDKHPAPLRAAVPMQEEINKYICNIMQEVINKYICNIM